MSAFPLELCLVEDIPDGGARGFDLGAAYEPREIFLMREGAAVFAYINSCPHLGTPLEMVDDQFVNDEGYIVCSTHGALFEPQNGLCISGPCFDDYLSRAQIRIEENGQILLLSLPFSLHF